MPTTRLQRKNLVDNGRYFTYRIVNQTGNPVFLPVKMLMDKDRAPSEIWISWDGPAAGGQALRGQDMKILHLDLVGNRRSNRQKDTPTTYGFTYGIPSRLEFPEDEVLTLPLWMLTDEEYPPPAITLAGDGLMC